MYRDKLNVNYVKKENSGPGMSRNEGCKHASGDYFVFLDSDCILPPQYISEVKKQLDKNYSDAYGGPDAAMEDFTLTQRAINYSMTSFFSTGGIRGGNERMEKFHPRSFNMGFSREVYLRTGGFSAMRFGEDIDMSIRITKNGFTTQLIKSAYVYHRRRTNLHRFFKQVYNSGIARINLHLRHPGTLKVVHTAPAIFTVGVATILLLTAVISPLVGIVLALHALFIFIDAAFRNKSISIGLLAIITTYIQLIGYGAGFLHAGFMRLVLGKGEFTAYQASFYK